MRAICLALLLLVPGLCQAGEISIGDVALTIPNPSEFQPVTREMAPLYEFQKQFVPSMNVEFVAFVPEQAVPAALRGEIPEMPRRFSIQTAKTLVDPFVTNSGFAELKSTIKNQREETIEKLGKDTLPELMKNIGDGLSEDYDVDLTFSTPQVVPIPVHAETDRTMAYSAMIKYEVTDGSGNLSSYVVAATSTLVLVRGKVLFLYCYAEALGLDWSREASRQWAHAVIAANPSGFSTSVREKLPSFLADFDLGGLGFSTAAGAILGALVGGIGWMIRRRKEEKNGPPLENADGH